jgi:hypothetical protein
LCVIVHFDISFATAIPTQIKTEGGTYTDHNNRDFVKTPIPGLATLSLDLLAQDVLEGDGVGGEFRDTLAQLLDSHLVLVEEEAELGLVVDVGLLFDVERSGVAGVELLGDRVLRVVELLK